jgi:hypothetical protein
VEARHASVITNATMKRVKEEKTHTLEDMEDHGGSFFLPAALVVKKGASGFLENPVLSLPSLPS